MKIIAQTLVFVVCLVVLAQCHRKAIPASPDTPILPQESDTIRSIDSLVDIDTLLLIDTVVKVPDTLLFFKQSGCFGHCPVYQLLFLEDSTVHYEGIRHVDFEGVFTRKMTTEGMSKLHSWIEDYRLSDLEERYPAILEDWIPDLPSTAIIFKRDGDKHMIFHNHSGPENLIQFEQVLRSWVKSQEWIETKSSSESKDGGQ